MLKERRCFYFLKAQNNNIILLCYTTERVMHMLKDEFWSFNIKPGCLSHFCTDMWESTFYFMGNASIMALKFGINIIPAVLRPLWKQDCLSFEAVLASQGLNKRNKCSSILQNHSASELCIFQDSVRRTSKREASFHIFHMREEMCITL